MKIVITGATGMIGSSLAETAIDNKFHVLSINRINSPNAKNLPISSLHKSIECDISGYDSISADCIGEKYDVFYHLAWDKTSVTGRDDVFTQCNNIKYTLDAVNLAKRLGCHTFVGAGSQAEYGSTEQDLNERVPTNPTSGYGIAKLAAGRLSRLQCGQLGIRHCWTRILSVYGEKNADTTLIKYCVNTLLNGESPSLTKCEQIWDYLYSKDVAEALLAIGEKGINGRVYCLGSGNTRQLKDYVTIIRDIINPELRLGFGEKEYYPHQAMYLSADITDLINDTGYKPETDFISGAQNVISYCKKHNKHESEMS